MKEGGNKERPFLPSSLSVPPNELIPFFVAKLPFIPLLLPERAVRSPISLSSAEDEYERVRRLWRRG